MTDEITYNKKYHFLDSFSVFLDIDSLIYILISALLIWAVANGFSRMKKGKKIRFGTFVSKYMIICAIPVFLFYAVMLIMSGVYVYNNIVVLFLPLLYAAIIQFVVRIILKNKKNSK